MFVLYKSTKLSDERSYFIAAGYEGNVKRQISNQKIIPEMNEILKINSDIKVINSLKLIKDELLNFHCAKEKLTVKSENNLIKSVILEFLKYHGCMENNLQVCRDCGLMMKKSENERIGTIALKEKKIGELLNARNDWACHECRLEFSIIAWKVEKPSKQEKNYVILIRKRKDIEKCFTLLIRKYGHVQTIVNIRPSYRDDKISYYVKKKFVLKEIDEINRENETNCTQLIIQTFLNYYYEMKKITKNYIRICKKCGEIFLNSSTEGIGSTSLDINELCEQFRVENNWACRTCGDIPSLVLNTRSSRNIDDYFEVQYLNNNPLEFQNSQTDMVPCLELFTTKVKSDAIEKKIREIGDFEITENKLRTNLSKKDAVNKIIQMFIAKLLQNVKPVLICDLCQHIFNNKSEELGYFWVNRAINFEYQCKSNYTCPFHGLNNILYWNMSGWNTLSRIDESKKSVLKNRDIICFTETHITPGTFINFPEFLSERIVFVVSAEKSQFGRGSGGLILLVKKTINCNLKRLEFSNKGIFIELKLKNDSFIIGVIYWRPDTREESLDDWINELDNFINVHKTNEVKFILGGDFNGRIAQLDAQPVGKKSNLFQKRESADTKYVKRGRLLIKLMTKHKFILCNGRCKSDKPGNFTSHTVNGDSVVDYIWISENCIDLVKDMSVMDIESNSASYHRGLALQLKKGS